MRSTFAFAVVFAMALIAAPAHAQQKSDRGEPPRLVFKPPSGDAPKSRTSGGGRGPAFSTRSEEAPKGRTSGGSRGDEAQEVWLVTPETEGLTVAARPVLAWVLKYSTEAPIVVTVNRPALEPEPDLEMRLEGPHEAGLHALNLSEHDFDLKHNEPYKWVVMVEEDNERIANNPLASGTIRFVEQELTSPARNAEQAAAAFAEAGIWHDMLAAVVELTRGQQREQWLQTLDELLAQVALPEAAKVLRNTQRVIRYEAKAANPTPAPDESSGRVSPSAGG